MYELHSVLQCYVKCDFKYEKGIYLFLLIIQKYES